MDIIDSFVCSMANDPKRRISVIFSKCTLKCQGCSNNCAKVKTVPYSSKEEEILENLGSSSIAGLAILGEPCTVENIDYVLDLSRQAKELYPKKDIWIWSNMSIEEMASDGYEELLIYADVIIDGEYDPALKDSELKYRGSTNQRIFLKDQNGEFQIAAT